MKTTIIIGLFCVTGLLCRSQNKYQKDFNYYWQTVDENFAYFNLQKTNWPEVKKVYSHEVDTISSDDAFLHLLERTNNELYNGHVFLNRNTNASNRPIPTGADVKIIWKGGQFVIAEIRDRFSADLCGLRPGMVVTQVNGQPIQEAIKPFLPRSVKQYDATMYEFAGNMVMAGTHDKKRAITVRWKDQTLTFNPDSTINRTELQNNSLLEVKMLPGEIGYIKVSNSLGNCDLIGAFDRALDSFQKTKGLILDLSETPSGGTTFIARAIMGRFIEKEMPYQKHIYTAEEKETGIRRASIELVTPRPKTYKQPMVIVVGYWTGSMGEGMAIGFDAMKRGEIVGSPMAGLLGEIYSFETPETKIPFSFPCVQLQHVNGQPREDYKPVIMASDHQAALKKAHELLLKKSTRK